MFTMQIQIWLFSVIIPTFIYFLHWATTKAHLYTVLSHNSFQWDQLPCKVLFNMSNVAESTPGRRLISTA